MTYREIVSVTGLTGLFQLLTTKSDGAIVRSVGEKTTKFISARQHNVTPLESIEVYTIGENIKLEYVFFKMMENEATRPVAEVMVNDKKQITAYFKAVLPELDEDRVYVSDMKKMLKWYELLKQNDLLKFETDKEDEKPVDTNESASETPEAIIETAAHEEAAK